MIEDADDSLFLSDGRHLLKQQYLPQRRELAYSLSRNEYLIAKTTERNSVTF